MIDQRTHAWKRILPAALLLSSTLGIGCGPMIFEDASALRIVGTKPAQPEPEAAPAPEPAKPKRVQVTADKIVINEKIQFDYNKATIKSESHGLLDELVQVIKENAHIKKLSIEGHTDADGSNKYNKKLSNKRAASVQAYFTEHGVAEGRLTSQGWGEEKPIADNESDDGKATNRRVEFIITEQAEVKKLVEIDPETGEQREVKRNKKKPKGGKKKGAK
jgi:outer membrane protein OmpA-like peptidoglycan-associated protein